MMATNVFARTFAFAALLLVGTSAAFSEPVSHEVTLERNTRIRVTFEDQTAPAPPQLSTRPRVGVLGWDALSQALDATDKADVVSSTRLRAGGAPGGNSAPLPQNDNEALQRALNGGGAAGPLDGLTRSETREAVNTICTANRLNYLYAAGASQASMGVDASAYIFGMGRMRNRSAMTAQLYLCPTDTIAWQRQVTIESSSGVLRGAFGGSIGSAGGASDRAAADLVARQIVEDMRW